MKKIVSNFLILVLLASVTALIIGCNPQAGAMRAATKDAKNPETAKAFEKWFNQTIEDVKNNPNYKRIPLDTKNQQEWFLSELFMAWDKKISKEEFTEKVLQKYPGYEDSVKFITDKLP